MTNSSDNLTKLDNVDKSDPELDKKTSDLINTRMQEELRKAQLREEIKMATARKEAAEKKNMKNNNETPQVAPQKVVETTIETSDDNAKITKDEFVTESKMREVVQNINKSFAFIEKFIQEQNSQNAKMDKFVNGLQALINEYNKK